jgi:putative membrane protein
MNNVWHYGMGFEGWIIPLLIIAFLYYFFKESGKKESPSAAQDILDRRYANGGIDKKEYQEKSKQIKEQAKAS